MWLLTFFNLSLPGLDRGLDLVYAMENVISYGRSKKGRGYVGSMLVDISLAWPHQGKGSVTWPKSSLLPRTVECIPITAQYSVT